MKNWVTKYVENCEQCHRDSMTARTVSPTTPSLHSKICKAQEQYRTTLEEWGPLHSIDKEADREPSDWLKGGHLVIPPDEMLRREILQLLHDTPTAGHPGQDETLTQVSRSYWWPGMRVWVADYVVGCAVCQQNKNITHHARTLLYHIPTLENTLPFQQVALCYGLPRSMSIKPIGSLVWMTDYL